MMRDKNRWILAGTWTLLVACAIGGYALIQAQNEPKPVAFVPAKGLPPELPEDPAKEARKRLLICLTVPPPPKPGSDFIGYLQPKVIVVEKDPIYKQVLMPAVLLYSGAVEIDRSLLTWKLIPVDPKFQGIKSTPKAILIHRQVDGGEIERIAVLEPKAVTYEDRDVLPGRSYRYWVLLHGMEGLQVDINPPPLVDKPGEGVVEGRTPEWIKIHLVGGDASRAIMNVETYNPLKGRWETTVAQAAVGQPIGRTGWTLERTRFDRFTLIAEVKDDRSEIRLLSTRKD